MSTDPKVAELWEGDADYGASVRDVLRYDNDPDVVHNVHRYARSHEMCVRRTA